MEGKFSKEKYTEAKRMARRQICEAKTKVEVEQFDKHKLPSRLQNR